MRILQGSQPSWSWSTTYAACNDTRSLPPIRLPLTIPRLIDPYVIMCWATHALRHALPFLRVHWIVSPSRFLLGVGLCVSSRGRDTHANINTHIEIAEVCLTGPTLAWQGKDSRKFIDEKVYKINIMDLENCVCYIISVYLFIDF